MPRPRFLVGAVLLFILILCALISLHAGQAAISWEQVFDWILGRNPDINTTLILKDLRLPRTVATLLIGALLGACGLTLQTILRNPLAEPYTLGLSGGASLGAVAALALDLSPQALWVPSLSVAGCLCAATLVFLLGRRHMQFESRSLILFGVLTSLFFGALVVFGFSVLSPQKLQTAMFWLLGEFGSPRDQWIWALSPLILIPLFILFLQGPNLDGLSLGEARAASLGVDVARTKIHLAILCAWLTALGVAIAGLIGFIGLVSPHIVRRVFRTSQHGFLMVASSTLGAALLTLADCIGRSFAKDFEIPSGSVSALIGAPALIFLLLRMQHARIE